MFRADTTKEALAKLKPVFKLNGPPVMLPQTSDGAAFVVVMSEALMKQLNLTPEARLVSCAVDGVDPFIWESVLLFPFLKP